jgi:rhodanese-related sulfurtransferase
VAADAPVAPWGRLGREAGLVLALSIVWALAWNALAPDGVGLFEPIPSRAARDRRFIDHATAERLWREQRVLFVDVRNLAAWNLGHIPRAVYVPFDDLGAAWEREGARLLQASQASELILYCDGPHCDLAVRLSKTLAGFGCERIRIYEGGWESWYASGLPREPDRR